MDFVLFSLVLSAGFVTLVYFTGRWQGAPGICSLAGVVMVISFCIFPILAVQAFFTFVMVAACSSFGAKQRAFFACSILAAIASFSLAYISARGELQEIADLKEEFAFESMADRLDYEQREDIRQESPVVLGVKVEQQLDAFEDSRDQRTSRSYMLRRLHDQKAAEFVLARGFGVTRMIRVSRGRVELPESKPIPLPSSNPTDEYELNDDHPQSLARERRDATPQPSTETLLGMHINGLRDFVDEESLGYMVDRQQVAGFESHSFQYVPTVADDAGWQVTRLELISLLRHKEPVAYVSKNLPNMEELKDVPTRRMTAFERSALIRLRSEEDVVVDDGVNRIRMVGSLRASQDCLECHSVQRGELLGAFSYDIMRVQFVPEPEPVEPQARMRRLLHPSGHLIVSSVILLPDP